MSTDCISNLLLVEDNAQDADLFQHLIHRSEVNAQVTQVMGLKEAIAACKRQTFDVVLLDLNLPDSEGKETAAEFCGIFSNLPVLILSDLPEGQMGDCAISEGAQDYLAKDDLTSAQLVRAMRYAVRRQAWRTRLMHRNDALFEELERQIQQSRIKFGFISAATHQLKSPLNLIAVCVESLQLANAEPDVQQRRKRLGQMEQAIAAVFEFLDTIQLTSVDAAQQASCTPAKLEIEDFCQDVIASLAMTFADSVCVKLQVEDLWGEIQLDPVLLRYVLLNLLSNAVKYSPPGETVELTVSRSETWIKFLISDRGIGIPSEEQSKILNPFYRATNARIAQPGSGLGLAIVQTCVELHQGNLEIESRLDHGTQVAVCLPLALDEADA